MLESNRHDRESSSAPARRDVLNVLAGLGIGTVPFQRSLAAQVANQSSLNADMIRQAEWVAGIELS